MSTQTTENNKRIAKNTLYLNLRMLVFFVFGGICGISLTKVSQVNKYQLACL